jgi:tetratricopeptide (TPR) repeat protein/nucleoside phosphorylase
MSKLERYPLGEIPETRNSTISEFAGFEPDIAILTATVTERDSVLVSMRPLSGWTHVLKIASGPDTFYLGILGRQTIVLTMCGMGAVGRDGSSLTASDAIRTWNPKGIIAVGIAFGIDPDKQGIGDVLVSRTVSSYEPQRVQDDLIIFRGVVAESGLHLFNRFINVQRWRFQRPDGSPVELRAGQILSGEKLVDSSRFKKRLLERYPEAIGGEMEGAGLYAAAERAKVEWIIVKGICDWADGNKDKHYQRFAAAAAVSLVEHVLNDANAVSDLRRPRETTSPALTQSAKATVQALFQLPSTVGDFVGRENEIAMLLEVLQPSQRSTVASINGLPGSGKSELAICVANQLRPSYLDAQLFIRMSGVDGPPREPSEVLAACIRELIGANVESTSNIDLLINQYRTCLARKRALIVLDNVVDDAQARPLLPPIGSAVIITSRNSLSLSPLTRLFLDQLRPQEAKALFTSIVPRVPPDVADEISSLCGCLPLAVRAAATLLAVSVDLDPNSFLETLRREHTRLEKLSSHEAGFVSVNASFNLSYQNLSSELAKVLRQLTVFVESFDAQVEEFVCNDPNHQALSELVKRSLVAFDNVTRRYHLHDLFRLFAKNQISVAEDLSYEKRHATYYLELLERANNFSLRGGASYQEGLDLFDRDRGNIAAGSEWAKNHADEDPQASEMCVQYPHVGRDILDIRQSLTDRISTLEFGLAVGASDEEQLVTSLTNRLGWALARAKNVEKAMATLETGLALSRKLGNKHEEGFALDALGWCYAETDDLDPAVRYHEEALAIAKDIEDLRLQCRTLNNLGWAYVGIGNVSRAITFHQDALAIARELGDSYQEGVIIRYLARATAERKEVREAIDLYETGLTIFRSIGSKRDEWSVLDSLGTIYKDQGETLKAIDYYQKGLLVAEQDGNLESQSTALSNLGRAHYALGQYELALTFHEQDLALSRRMNTLKRERTARENLGDCYWELENFSKAHENYLQRLELNRRLKEPAEERRTLLDLGNLSFYFKQVERALDYYDKSLVIAKQLNDETGEAWALYNLGRAYAQLRQPAKAVDFHERGLSIFCETKDLDGQIQAVNQLAEVLENNEQFEEALKHLNPIYELLNKNRDKVAVDDEIRVLFHLGVSHCKLGDTTKGLPLFHEALTKVNQSDDRTIEISLLTMIGYFQRQTNIDLAIKYAEKGLSLAVEREEKLPELKAALFLGDMCREKDPARAISLLERVISGGSEVRPLLSISDENFPLWQASVIKQIAYSHYQLEDYALAISTAERAIDVFREFNDKEREADILRLLGASYSQLRNEERAIECLEKAVAFFHANNNAAFEGDCLVRLVFAYQKLGDITGLRKTCEVALPFFQAASNQRLELVTLAFCGMTLHKSGDLDQAEYCFDRALQLSRELDNPDDPYVSEPATMIEIGDSYLAIGEVKRGIEFIKSALPLARARSDKYLEGAALNKLGSAFSKIDQRRRAIGWYKKAVSAFAEGGKQKERCNALLNLGKAYREVGEVTLSLDTFNQALELAHEFRDRRWERRALAGVGITYRQNLEQDQAMAFMEKALNVARQISDRIGEGLTLLELGQSLNELAEHERAINLQEKALLIFNEVRSRSDEAEGLQILGDSYRKIGQIARAMRLHEEGLVIAREYSEKFREVCLLGSLAEDHLKAGALNKAEEISNLQLQLSRELGDQCGEANAEFHLAQIIYANGNQPLALERARAALKVMRRIESARANDVLGTIKKWRATSDHLKRPVG